ncbi:MAG TPA: S41 family peptidase [Anaerolineae bacterium]|nr:S41 family peptidase [Anaerolineae bacterium]
MKANKRIILTAVLLVLVLGLGVAGGIALDRQVLNVSAAVADIVPATSPDLKADTASTAGPDLKLIQDAWQTIQQHYVDRSALQSQSLTYGAISGMVDALGDNGHSRFLSPDMLKAEHNSLNGQFEGIGAELQEIDGHAVIVAPFDDSPAQQASLLPDDVILKVNGEDVTQLPLNQVVQRILGPAGTNVTLTVLTPATGKMRDVTITRAKITLHNLTWQQIPGTTIADVRLAEFSKGVSQDLQQALTEIKDQKLTGIILDLRNNPGGLLDEAIGVSSEFLADGNVLEEQDATGKITPIPISHDYLTTTLPMVVLINQGSASASEITAGALQDAGRATIVGETTFGTGTVLNDFNLPDGSALLLAVQEWLTPKGRVIWHHGITPDDQISLPASAHPLLPSAERSMTPDQVRASGDAQLLRALEQLTASTTP